MYFQLSFFFSGASHLCFLFTPSVVGRRVTLCPSAWSALISSNFLSLSLSLSHSLDVCTRKRSASHKFHFLVTNRGDVSTRGLGSSLNPPFLSTPQFPFTLSAGYHTGITCDTVSIDRPEKGQHTGGSVSCFSTEPTRVACLPNNKKAWCQ